MHYKLLPAGSNETNTGNDFNLTFHGKDFNGMAMKFKTKGVLSGDEIKLSFETEMGGCGGGPGGRPGGAASAKEFTVKRVK